jgi:hypothetical protein
MAMTLFTHDYERTLKLGVNHAWIDSLRIMQDDADD